jgi:hypothetical protein
MSESVCGCKSFEHITSLRIPFLEKDTVLDIYTACCYSTSTLAANAIQIARLSKIPRESRLSVVFVLIQPSLLLRVALVRTPYKYYY